MSQQQVCALRACSLLVIPPPAGRVVPQGGFPTDLANMNLTSWAALVQDMVASLQALPPRLSHGLGPQDSCPAPAAGGSYRSRVLSPFLQSKTSL